VRTVAQELTLYNEVGRGRYAIVYKARWHDHPVAAKVVHAFDEISWRNEVDMYQTCNLSHENILGFVAGDIMEPIPGQDVRRLVITNFHEFGSLYDFLQNHSYDGNVLFRLAYTALSGIVHIHRFIPGSYGKPYMAHRNITSKNILVKENLQCCVRDFSLAVKYSDAEAMDFRENPRYPTFRYMAPDMLEDLTAVESYPIETYQKSDLYAFGLVLWEMVLRYEVKGRCLFRWIKVLGF